MLEILGETVMRLVEKINQLEQKKTTKASISTWM